MFTVGKATVSFDYGTISGLEAYSVFSAPRKFLLVDTLRVTSCYIVVDGVVKMTGFAICSPKDAFSKETGRKLALKRAIASLSKAARTIVWEAYFNSRIDHRDYAIYRGLTDAIVRLKMTVQEYKDAVQKGVQETDDTELVKAYVPDADYLSYREAVAVARQRDCEAASELEMSIHLCGCGHLKGFHSLGSNSCYFCQCKDYQEA